MNQSLYHITDHETWKRALRNGHYTVESLDCEGFIHCSFRHQVTKVASAFYSERADLLLLEIDPNIIESEIVLEGEAEGFPHVYGPINLSAVTRISTFGQSQDGSFAFPADFA